MRSRGGQVRHCWVEGCPEVPGRWPGLLMEWARGRDGGWAGRVVLVVDGQRGPVQMTLWVAAEHLRPLAPPQ